MQSTFVCPIVNSPNLTQCVSDTSCSKETIKILLNVVNIHKGKWLKRACVVPLKGKMCMMSHGVEQWYNEEYKKMKARKGTQGGQIVIAKLLTVR